MVYGKRAVFVSVNRAQARHDVSATADESTGSGARFLCPVGGSARVHTNSTRAGLWIMDARLGNVIIVRTRMLVRTVGT